MAGLNTEGLAEFKAPILPKGKYEVEVMSGRDVEGNSVDDNNEKSSGWGFRLQVVGPEDATLSDGNSALGFTFEQRVWFPREALKKNKPQAAARMTKSCIEFMKAAFGEIPAGDCHGKDFEHSRFMVRGRSKYDAYNKEDLFEVEEAMPLGDTVEQA